MYPNWILQRAYLTPTRIALTFKDQSWTFEQLKIISVERAEQLVANGIEKGSRVAILGNSHPRLIFMMLACMHLQCEMVMLNRRLAQAELAYQIEDAEVNNVLVDDGDVHKLPDNTPVIIFSTVEKSTRANISVSQEWKLTQTTSIMYTSGTTGFPKGVRQTVGNHQASATASVLNIGLAEDDVWLCAVPLFHISGFSILVRSLLYGNQVKLYSQFDKDSVVEDIARGTVTHMSVVAVTLERILHGLEEKHLKASSRFKVMLAGGGPVPKDYIERAHKLGLGVSQTYGMTETSSQTATLSNVDALRKIGSAGKPLFFNQIHIDGANRPNVEGEICIRGPHVTPGYIGRFADKEVTIDGWLPTGDIGYVDDEGYLYVVDRRSDLIISGGENVYPSEIENVLLSHHLVQEAGVCGIDDAQWGQVPVAFIVSKEKIDSKDLGAFCYARLARYKVPKDIVFVDALPRNGSNKLMRRKLREIYDR